MLSRALAACFVRHSPFLLDISVVSREIEDSGYAKLWGGGINKVLYGICENGEFYIRTRTRSPKTTAKLI